MTGVKEQRDGTSQDKRGRGEKREEKEELTYRPLLEPGERLDRVAGGRGVVEDEEVAVVADGAGGAPHLDADDDEADEPEHEEHEGAEDDDGGEQPPLRDQPQQQDDEDDRQRRHRDPVGEVPVFPPHRRDVSFCKFKFESIHFMTLRMQFDTTL